MNRKLFSAAAVVATLVAPGLFAASGAMAVIPNDAVTVGVVRLSDMRTSPLSSLLFQQTDKISTDGDAERFLRDAGLQPTKDVDLLVVATSPRQNLGGGEGEVLIAAEGRFNAARLTSALVARGAVKKGNYYVMPDKGGEESHEGAVAFPDDHLALLGSESAVAEALTARANGGTTFLSASGLGRDLVRVDPKATAWALVDVTRAARLAGGGPKLSSHTANAQALTAAIKNVSTVALWATDAGDSLKLGAFGIAHDSETLGLLEDTLRGALSAMRLAVADKQPDLVSVLRKFSVSRTDDSVTISGTLPADQVKALMAKHRSASGAGSASSR